MKRALLILLLLLLAATYALWPESEPGSVHQPIVNGSDIKPSTPSTVASFAPAISSTLTGQGRQTATSGTAPVVTAPADVNMTTPGSSAIVSLGEATVTDDKDQGLQAVPDHKGLFPIGIHFVRWHATDSDGLSGEAVQRVIVKRKIENSWIDLLPFREYQWKSYTLLKGETIPLQVIGQGELDQQPRLLRAEEVQWQISDPAVISVEDNLLVAKKLGLCLLIMRFGGKSAWVCSTLLRGRFVRFTSRMAMRRRRNSTAITARCWREYWPMERLLI